MESRERNCAHYDISTLKSVSPIRLKGYPVTGSTFLRNIKITTPKAFLAPFINLNLRDFIDERTRFRRIRKSERNRSRIIT